MSEYASLRRGADVDTLRRSLTRLAMEVEELQSRRLEEEEALRTVRQTAAAARQAEEEEESVRQQQAAALKKEILRSTQQVLQSCSTSLNQLEDRLTARVTAEAEARSGVGTLAQRLESVISQTAGEITTLFTRQEAVQSALQSLTQTQAGYQRFSAQGLELGQAGSPFTVLLGNDRLSFRENGAEIAAISGNALGISSARVADMLSVGGVTFSDDGNALVLK